MKHLDLFSGIGGFALAARRVGWETVGFCDREPYCQKVLAKHWPGVPIYEDVRKISDPDRGRFVVAKHKGKRGTRVEEKQSSGNFGGGYVTDGTTTVGPVDIITGGFPCQDISYAGKGAGIEGERSGLWTELARIIGEVRPRWAVLENVAALLSRGLDRVAGDLAEIGYDCEWHCIPASAIGAPHRRDRIWIIAYPQHSDADSGRLERFWVEEHGELESESGGEPDGLRAGRPGNGSTMADAGSARGQAGLSGPHQRQERQTDFTDYLGDELRGQEATRGMGWWATEPDVGRVAHGVPDRVDRLRGLGNAIVPQVAEVIFEAINEVS